jgi:cellulose synthase/poly-beta-1,6-N-acetylglucosamine synthase-like glycosyltransferase
LADMIMVFDADYLPSRGLLKHLAVPFLDPVVGAVMGRVVPQNAGSNLLTRVLDLERAGGYQVDQTARQNIGAVPQYGGTVGGIRLSALADAGGWHDDVLAEDTDLTFRLLLSGWKTIYLNKAECYEEVPESWAVRARQIGRWAKGHNQALVRHLWPLIKSPKLDVMEKLDGAALLGVYMMSPLLLLSWALVLILFYAESGFALGGALAVLSVISCAAFGNSAAFFQVAVASHLDGKREGIKLLPFMMVGFLVSSVSISLATWQLFITDRLFKRALNWDKTLRYRTSAFTQPVYSNTVLQR